MNCSLQYVASESSSYSSGDGSSHASSGTIGSSKIDLALLGAYSVEEWIEKATGLSYDDESYSSSKDSFDNDRDDDRRSARKKDILTELASASSSSSESCATDPSIQQIYDIESYRDPEEEECTVESGSRDDEPTDDANEEINAKDKIASAKKKGKKAEHPRKVKMRGRSFGNGSHNGRPMETISVTESKGKNPLRWIPIKIRRSFRRQSERTDVAVLSNPRENRDDLLENRNQEDANSDESCSIPAEIEERDGNQELDPAGCVDDGSARDLQTRQKSEVDSYSMIPNLSLPEKCKNPESTDDFFSTQGFELSLGNGVPGSSGNRKVTKKHSLLPWKKNKPKATTGPVPVYEASTATENVAPATDESSCSSERRDEEVSVSTTGSSDSNDYLLSEEYPSALAIVRQNFTRKGSRTPDSKNDHQNNYDSATEDSSKASTQETNQDISEDEGEMRPMMKSTRSQKAQRKFKRKKDHGIFSFMPFGSHSLKSKPPTGRNHRSVTAGRKETFKGASNTSDASDLSVTADVTTRQAPVQSTYFFDPEAESVSEQEESTKEATKDLQEGNRMLELAEQEHKTLQEQSSEEQDKPPAIMAPIIATIGAAVAAASLSKDEVESSDGQSSTKEIPNNHGPERTLGEEKQIKKESSLFGKKRNRVTRRRSKSLGSEKSPVKEKRRFNFSAGRKKKNVANSTLPATLVADPPAQEIPRKRSYGSESDGVGEILDGPLASPYLLQLWDGSCSPNRVTVPQEEPVVSLDTNSKERKDVAKEPEIPKDKNSGSECGNSFSSGLGFGADTILLGSLLPSEMAAAKQKSDKPTNHPIFETTPVHSERANSKPSPLRKKLNRSKAKDTSDLQNIVHKIKKLKEIRDEDSLREGSLGTEKPNSDVVNQELREPISFRVRRSLRSNSIRLVDQTTISSESRDVELQKEDWYDDLMPWGSKKSREDLPSHATLHRGARKGKQRTLADQVMLAKQSDMPNHKRSRSRSNAGENDEDWYKDLLPWTWSA